MIEPQEMSANVPAHCANAFRAARSHVTKGKLRFVCGQPRVVRTNERESLPRDSTSRPALQEPDNNKSLTRSRPHPSSYSHDDYVRPRRTRVRLPERAQSTSHLQHLQVSSVLPDN